MLYLRAINDGNVTTQQIHNATGHYVKGIRATTGIMAKQGYISKTLTLVKGKHILIFSMTHKGLAELETVPEAETSITQYCNPKAYQTYMKSLIIRSQY